VAVVQISRIQIRRGQKNTGTGLPQSASGELGWAIDTQELYIGNGAVSEGAPAVGNTNILTEHSNLFEFASAYTYLSADGVVQTGPSSSSPIQRTLQQRLDDIVSIRAFGCKGDGTNCTIDFQRAVDQLFINPSTKGTAKSRVILHIEPGEYVLDDVIYVPPFATIVGAGAEKTILKQTSGAPVFRTVNGTSTPGTPASDATSTTLNQARYIRISGMTLDHTGSSVESLQKGIQLDSCADSVFEDLKIIGSYESGFPVHSTSIGIELNALSTVTTSKNNLFKNIKITGYSNGISSKWDIDNNKFTDVIFETLANGVVFGQNIVLGAQGQSVGPTHNIISNSLFKDIDQKGIWINAGQYNTSQSNRYIGVGNLGGTSANATYSILHFNDLYNETKDDYFERLNELSYETDYIGDAFVPIVEGNSFFETGFNCNVSVGEVPTPVTVFKLPADSTKIYGIDYWYNSSAYNALRSGNISIVLDMNTENLQIIDEYDYVGDFVYKDRLKFNAVLSDLNGDGDNDTVAVTVQNTALGDEANIKFKVVTKS